ncbi:MAG: hypothetical protein M1836_001510 [Candelina mexicana]|nr:MAG: hypothetical protein M1836_001510 [Candelina mexicana]
MAPLGAKSDLNIYRQQSSSLKPLSKQAARRRGIERKQSVTPSRKSPRLRERQRLREQSEIQEQIHQLLSPTSNSFRKKGPQNPSASVRPPDPDRKRKRTDDSAPNYKTEAKEVEQLFPRDYVEPGQKRPRISPASCTAEDKPSQEAASSTNNSGTHIYHWIQEGNWPREYFEQDSNMSQSLIRKRSTPSLSNQQSDISGVSLREGKNPAVRSRRYEQILASAGIYMDNDDEVVTTDACKILCQTLLDTEQTVPQDSLFNDDIFERICQKVRNRNETRVIRDLSPLLIPSAEVLYVCGAKHLKHLVENVDEGWIKSIPLVKGPRPQPDFSVGLKSTAFTSDQLKKLKPFVGDWQDTSRLVATDEMYFPFLTAEVKCGNEALNIADRQNAHSASIAVNAVVELYRAVSRQDELHREILAFSVSHDNEAVRIYGHYALIDGASSRFYRHTLRKFDFTEQNGKDKWITYKFTRCVYDTFVPIHLERICDAVDQLPDPEGFLVQPLSQQSNAESVEQDDSQSTPSHSQEGLTKLPSSQTTEPVFKKPKGKGTTD